MSPLAGFQVIIIGRFWVIAEADEKQLPMFRRTADLVAEVLQRPKHEIAISELSDLFRPLKRFLEVRRFKRNSVRSYRNYLRILIQKAKALGWALQVSEAELAWKKVLAEMPRTRQTSSITWVARYAIQKNIKPSQFSDKDLDDCGNEALQRGQKYKAVRFNKVTFRRQVHKHAVKDKFTCLSPPKKLCYGTRFSELRDALKTEIQGLMTWKTAEFMLGRPKRLKHRAVSAATLLGVICRLHGFLTVVLGMAVETMAALFSSE
jgi:hypothetical protein